MTGDFLARLNRAQADPKFQFFLARCFGVQIRGIDTVTGMVCVGYEWRGRAYVTQFIAGPQK